MFIGPPHPRIPPIGNNGLAGVLTPDDDPPLVTEVYSSSGESTTTVPATPVGKNPYTKMYMRLWGAAGAGGKTATGAAGAGGSGGYAERYLEGVVAGQARKVEVGAGGAIGTGADTAGPGGGGGGVTGVYSPTVGVGNEVVLPGGGAGGGGGGGGGGGAGGAGGGNLGGTGGVATGVPVITALTAFDVVGTSNADFSISVQAGSNRGLVLLLALEGEVLPTSVTVGGVATTLVKTVTNTDGVGSTTAIYIAKEANLTTGSMTVAMGDVTPVATIYVCQINNWDQVTPTGTSDDSNSVSNANQTTTTTVAPSGSSLSFGVACTNDDGTAFTATSGTGTWSVDHEGAIDGARMQTARQNFTTSGSKDLNFNYAANAFRMVSCQANFTVSAAVNGNGGVGSTSSAGGAGGTGSVGGTAGASRDGGEGAETGGGSGGGGGGSVGGGIGGDGGLIASGAGGGGGASGAFGGGGGGSSGAGGGGGGGGSSGAAPSTQTTSIYRKSSGTPMQSEPNYVAGKGVGGAAGVAGGTGLVVVTYGGDTTFKPTDVTTQAVVAWYRRGIGLTINASAVQFWRDFTGAGTMAASGGNPGFNETTRAITGDGVDDAMVSADTVAALFGNQRFSVFAQVSGAISWGNDGAAGLVVNDSGMNYNGTTAAHGTSAAARTMAWLHDGTNIIVRRNGAQIASAAVALNGLAGAAGLKLLRSGGVNTAGDIEEFIILTHPTNNLTPTELDNMETYMISPLMPVP